MASLLSGIKEFGAGSRKNRQGEKTLVTGISRNGKKRGLHHREHGEKQKDKQPGLPLSGTEDTDRNGQKGNRGLRGDRGLVLELFVCASSRLAGLRAGAKSKDPLKQRQLEWGTRRKDPPGQKKAGWGTRPGLARFIAHKAM